MTKFYRKFKGEDSVEEISHALYIKKYNENYIGKVQDKFHTQFAEYYTVEEDSND
jgi:hypothetical protein